ncbi:hypothetical protein [Mannheimia massilioguelmaensis]|uniref:hypothetical protein n=1 Tax=Mannheimia massilioguelmaensis TaxID=1604354 RepID=UPI0005C98B79|nr:hypothetical protein [Mannheimia massilioguelmaensis]
MATTTPFQGSKFYLGVGLDATKKITACTLSPATITIASSGYAKGDAITIDGLGALNGTYPIKSVASDTGLITLADEVDWSGYDAPSSFTNATAAKVQWSDNFCQIKSIEGDGDTLGEEDVTTMCSQGTETEAGEIEYGSIKLTFFFTPATKMQQDLRKKFYSKENFPWLLVLTNKQGSLYGTGFIQTSPNFSGEVKGKYESGVTIKKAKRDYLLPVA